MSNPASSSGESGANLTFSGEYIKRDHFDPADSPQRDCQAPACHCEECSDEAISPRKRLRSTRLLRFVHKNRVGPPSLGLLAASHMFGAHMGWTELETALPIAERAALSAIRADSEDPWAHYALASVYLLTRNFDDSLAEFELAIRLNPSFSPARGYYGVALAYCGRWEEGDLAARQALRLSPRDPFAAVYCGVVAYAQFLGGNYDEAIRMARESLRQRNDFTGGHRVLVAAAGMAGMNEVAEAALQDLLRAQPNISLDWIAKKIPFKLDIDRERYLEGLRRAGLDQER